MKVVHLNYSDANGGAARAAYRIHRALLKENIDSEMMVAVSTTGDATVKSAKTKTGKVLSRVRPEIGGLLVKLLKSNNKILHSPAILPSGRVSVLNKMNANIVHLHWVQGETMSISEIGQIKKPIVWTLHDMWAFCGAEHVSWDNRWRDGYRKNNRPMHETGIDINHWVWGRKLKNWTTPFNIVAPSKWLASCVKDSLLMREWPVKVIPNCIDTDLWSPADKTFSRSLLGLPNDKYLLLFGTAGVNSAHHKGFDLLEESLGHLANEIKDLELVIFGENPVRKQKIFGFNTHYVGNLQDDMSLRILYSSADLLAIPSRIDNFPNTGIEAMSCGLPVIAFDTCGLPDIVSDKITGYLAKSFDTTDFANGIKWILSDGARLLNLNKKSREKAVINYSYDKIAGEYMKLYCSVIG